MHLNVQGQPFSFGAALGRLCLLPGDAVCSLLGLGQTEKRDLMRMLVNSLVWTVLGVVIVALVS
ncbi:MAG TPA: hypothetical protein VFX37_03490 [Pseudolabrys sp.]|nr:hypothetical protein [Pseudolabrys sp.]